MPSQVNLVDEMGGLNAAINTAIEAARLTSQPEITEFPNKQAPGAIFGEALQGSSTAQAIYKKGLGSTLQQTASEQIEYWNQFNDPKTPTS